MASGVAQRIASQSGGNAEVARFKLTVIEDDNGGLDVQPWAYDGYTSPQNPSEFRLEGSRDAEAVIVLDWSAISATDYIVFSEAKTQTVADEVANFILGTTGEFSLLAKDILASPIHLIGHSRGGSLMAFLARRLGENGIWVDQVTTLDPHPVIGDYGNGWYDSIKPTSNVVFADNYWRSDGPNPLEPFDFDGEAVPGAHDVSLLESKLSGPGYGLEHSDVHLWYHGTFSTSGLILDLETSVDPDHHDWYGGVDSDNSPRGPRTLVGFNYSRLGGGTRPGDGLWPTSFGSGARETLDRDDTSVQWPNVSGLRLLHSESQFTVGQRLYAKYDYQDFDSSTTVRLFFDNNRNPFDNGSLHAAGERSHESYLKPRDGTVELDTTAAPVGTVYLCAQITEVGDNPRTRFAYIQRPLRFVAPPSSTPEITGVTPGVLVGKPLPGTHEITITGSGFTPDSLLTFSNGVATYPAKKPTSFSPTELRYNIKVGTNPASWTVRVVNGAISSNAGSFSVVSPTDAAAVGQFKITGTLDFTFNRSVDSFGNPSFTLANSTPNLVVNGNGKVHVPVTALSSQVDEMLWSNAAIWNNRFLPVDVSGVQVRKTVNGPGSGSPDVDLNVQSLIDALGSPGARSAPGGPTERTLPFSFDVTSPHASGMNLVVAVQAQATFGVTIPAGANVVLDQAAVVHRLDVDPGASLAGNAAIRVRSDVVNRGKYSGVSGTIEGDFINDGTPSAGEFAQLTGVDVQGQIVNTGELRITTLVNLPEPTENYGTIVIDGGSLSAAAFSNYGLLELASGAMYGNITNRGTLNWTGGTLSGTTTNSAGSMLNISGGGQKIVGGKTTLANAGVITHLGGATVTFGDYAGQNPSVLSNLAGGVYDLQGDGGFDALTGGWYAHYGTIINAGVFRKSAGAGASTVGGAVALHNTGTVEVTSGTLDAQGRGSNSGGTFAFANGGRFRLSGSAFDVLGLTTASGDGTFQVDGSVRVPSGADATFADFTDGARLLINSGSVSPEAGTTLTFNLTGSSKVELAGGYIAGAGATVNAGNFEWTAGGISTGNSGGLTNTSSTFTISGGGQKIVGGKTTLANAGVITHLGGATVTFGDYAGQNPSVLSNLAGGVYDLQGDGGFDALTGGWYAHYGTIINAGVFRKSAGAGASTVGGAVALHNTGTVEVIGGTLVISAGLTSTGTVNGDGTIAGPVNNTGSVRPGLSPGRLTLDGNYSQSADGRLEIEINGATAVTQYDRLAVNGAVSLAGSLNVALVYAPAVDDGFLVLDNDGSDPISGTFFGLPEGATFAVGGRHLRISYVGGTGNDVVLTAVADVPPQVTTVFVGSTAWSPSFNNYLASSGQGEAAFGFRINAGDQLNELPWTNVNRISIRFSEGVDVQVGDLVVRGVKLMVYPTSAFSYDAATFTATWTLAGMPTNDKLLLDLDGDAGPVPGTGGVTDLGGTLLDGEWNDPVGSSVFGDAFPSGNGSAGGDFRFRIHFLPGDANRNGAVQGTDVTLVRAAAGAAPGAAAYSIFKDIDGNGVVQGADAALVRERQGQTLPAGMPGARPLGGIRGSAPGILTPPPPTRPVAIKTSPIGTVAPLRAADLDVLRRHEDRNVRVGR
jgi:hypothetical protein